MPELPEIEIVKRSLFKMINKAKIINVTINNSNLRYKINSKFSKDLVGEKILKISRRSKYLILHLSKKLLIIHLGMSGKLLLLRQKDKTLFKTSFYYNLNIIPKHNHIYFFLNNGLILIYNDVRRFGFFKLFNNKNLKKISFFQKLGVEPLSNKLNENYFMKKKGGKEKIVNEILNEPFITKMSEKYPAEDVSKWRDEYILYYTDRKNIINDHRKNFEQWLLSFGKSK